MEPFTDEEKKLLTELLNQISLKPTTPGAIQTITLILGILEKLT